MTRRAAQSSYLEPQAFRAQQLLPLDNPNISNTRFQHVHVVTGDRQLHTRYTFEASSLGSGNTCSTMVGPF